MNILSPFSYNSFLVIHILEKADIEVIAEAPWKTMNDRLTLVAVISTLVLSPSKLVNSLANLSENPAN